MKQPVMIIMEVPRGSRPDELGLSMEEVLREKFGDAFLYAVPIHCTDEVPPGMMTA